VESLCPFSIGTIIFEEAALEKGSLNVFMELQNEKENK